MQSQYEQLSDRELLERILINQVTLMQQVYRMKDFLLEKYGEDFTKNGIHKGATYLKMLQDEDDFIRQYAEKKYEDDI